MLLPKPVGVLADSLGSLPDVNFYTSVIPTDLTNAIYAEDVLNGWGNAATAAKTARAAAAVPLYVSPRGVGWGDAAFRAALGPHYVDYTVLKKIISTGYTMTSVGSVIGYTMGSHPLGQGAPFAPKDWMLTYMRRLGFSLPLIGRENFGYAPTDTDVSAIETGSAIGQNIMMDDASAMAVKYPILRASAIPAGECWIWFQDYNAGSYKTMGWTAIKFPRKGALAGFKMIVATNGDLNTSAGATMKAGFFVGDPQTHQDFGVSFSSVPGAAIALDETLLTPSDQWVDFPLDPLGSPTVPLTGGLRRLGIRTYMVYPLSGFPQGVSVFTTGDMTIEGSIAMANLKITTKGASRIIGWPATLLSSVATAQAAVTTVAGTASDLTALANQTVYSYLSGVEVAGMSDAHRQTTIGRQAGSDIDGQIFIPADTTKNRPQLTFSQAGAKVKGQKYSLGHYMTDGSITAPTDGSVAVAGTGAAITATVILGGITRFNGLVTDMSKDDRLTVVEIYALGGTFTDNSGSGFTTELMLKLLCGSNVTDYLTQILDMLDSVRDFDDTWLFRRYGDPFGLSTPQKAAFELMQFSNPRTALSHVAISMLVYARASAKRVKRLIAMLGQAA